ncbi:MAG: two-component system, response regulator YesN [Petroclostridium sp.]|nr:putative response regulatory protein [Clostridia bacterium]MDK2809584.1 two-component system, response regulator YesN [Petroclostridium sp.]
MYKLLIVDDEQWIRQGLREVIDWEMYGISEVWEAEDGGCALDIIRKNQPDIVITDIRIPDVNGLELSTILKQEYPQIKVIFISGYQDFNYAREAISLGVYNYILKPLNENEVIKTVQKCIIDIEKERLQQRETNQPKNRFEELKGTGMRKIIREVVDYVNKYYNKKVSLASAADFVHLNPSYLSKLFCEEMGEPFTRYLMKVRIQKAKELLKEPRYKIYEVGDRVGYSDIKYFVKIFKDMEGMTPAEYRKKCLT